jgi:hypothetical protein
LGLAPVGATVNELRIVTGSIVEKIGIQPQ